MLSCVSAGQVIIAVLTVMGTVGDHQTPLASKVKKTHSDSVKFGNKTPVYRFSDTVSRNV